MNERIRNFKKPTNFLRLPLETDLIEVMGGLEAGTLAFKIVLQAMFGNHYSVVS